ncbi:MAG: hypothetical protein LRY40_01810 [Shewanella fodinae]|nr:hypothetical protein [Shewanella fodinae]
MTSVDDMTGDKPCHNAYGSRVTYAAGGKPHMSQLKVVFIDDDMLMLNALLRSPRDCAHSGFCAV